MKTETKSSEPEITSFFKDYEVAFDKLDMNTIARHTADQFLIANPDSAMIESRVEFIKKADQFEKMYRSIGQNSARILSQQIMRVSAEYSIATILWGVTVEKTGDELTEFQVSYLLQQIGEEIKVLAFITHQSEVEARKKLGVQK